MQFAFENFRAFIYNLRKLYTNIFVIALTHAANPFISRSSLHLMEEKERKERGKGEKKN